MPLSKLENLPLPDLLNLPQDLRELKGKIEATEHKKSMACFQDVDVPSIMQATDEWVPQMPRKLKARIHGVNVHHNIAGEKESEVVKAGRCMFDSLATVCLRTQGSRRMRARCLWLSSENVSLGSIPVTLSSQQGDRLLRGSSSNSCVVESHLTYCKTNEASIYNQHMNRIYTSKKLLSSPVLWFVTICTYNF
ncbi:hypothetical protein PsorP6_018110 [Peronosclerospora sorghi]|uniref:Uncharacterized protein n=1 Tax=Peronosclerospora sorghi TaxID=230839 RepID=A0ACC0WDF9_9STRA|nr:hypothetical protein PsorP6_018110 [Peronosclerospora sorghi]